ncbi:S-adenosyl-L-methionine-dependent methyltransferase [Fistulina hepatica ATCC 64428]|uniref:Trimethylguanosine synthase n=1 Tax=Fistulina hepatica ATCC 64428 TaxID=1128425 RepID=A0A0D7A765_9AGAR|nr:S-adenosyl-L-methionine-dependent methyltransferase [Fistulina hepatica ATCC 64428]
MGRRSGKVSGLGFFLKQSQDVTTVTVAPPALIPKKHQKLIPSEREPIEEPPSKKRKNNAGNAVAATKPVKTVVSSNWIAKYDASSLVPRYTDASEVPEHLKKYFYQRTRFLSRYDDPPGCLLDEEGWYSITPELIADQIADRCRSDTVIDAFCGVGGNAIAFAKTCQRVIALDISPTRLALARHNAQVYGVADRIEFILADYISFAEAYVDRHSERKRAIDVVFLSPPWGGPSYLAGSSRRASPSAAATAEDDDDTHPTYSLSSIKPIPGDQLFHLSRKITPNIAYYLPRNADINEVSELLDGTDETVEIEEEWMGNKLKVLTCYFGGLALGQEHLF